MTDQGTTANTTLPPTQWVEITPNDSADIAVCRALHIGTAGDIVVIGANDTASVTLTVAAGITKVGRFKRVLATGTTAGGIVAEY